MQVVAFDAEDAEPIARFESSAASSVVLGNGRGDAHVYCIHIAPKGQIGRHPAGFGQLFLVVQGSGWAAGADEIKVPLRTGQGAFFERGEMHSKGSDEGMVALMIQVTELRPTSAQPVPAE